MPNQSLISSSNLSSIFDPSTHKKSCKSKIAYFALQQEQLKKIDINNFLPIFIFLFFDVPNTIIKPEFIFATKSNKVNV